MKRMSYLLLSNLESVILTIYLAKHVVKLDSFILGA